jgi:biopolymer transport protein ExbD
VIGGQVVAHRKFDDPDSGFNLPITPMLDFTFQLLFFFMIYYNPSALEGQIEMNLPAPSTEASKTNTPSEVNESDVQSLPADITVVLGVQEGTANTGLIKRIVVKSRSGEEEVGDLDQLKQRLDSVRATVDNKEDIKIEPDSRLKWAAVVSVMDVCKKAGFKIGFGAPPDKAVTAPK